MKKAFEPPRTMLIVMAIWMKTPDFETIRQPACPVDKSGAVPTLDKLESWQCRGIRCQVLPDLPLDNQKDFRMPCQSPEWVGRRLDSPDRPNSRAGIRMVLLPRP